MKHRPLLSCSIYVLFAMVLGARSLFAQNARPQVGSFLLHQAKIYTLDHKNPQVDALAVRDGRIVAIGSSKQLMRQYPKLRKVDAGGKTVIPGLIDAHAHLMGLGESLLAANLVGTTSKAEIVQRLKVFAANQTEGDWVLGRGWDQNDWDEKVFPTAKDLDAAFPNKPVWLVRIDGHAGWGNTAALKRLGEAPDKIVEPDGGKIFRDEKGWPTGIFIDNAMNLIERRIPQPTESMLDRALQMAIENCISLGLTGVHDAGTSLTTLERYKKAINKGKFDLRVYAMADGPLGAFEHLSKKGPLLNYGNKLTMRSVKMYMDGALGSRGAALLEDYSDDTGNQGLLLTQENYFREIVQKAVQAGIQINTHAIGDRANRIVLSVYEEAQALRSTQDLRNRVEHAQIVALADVPRFARSRIIASMQPTHATSDMPWAQDRVGPERIKGGYVWQAMLNSGARLALGSDFPVEFVNPMLGFYAAITRQDAHGQPQGGWFPDQILSRTEALRGFTLDAAYAAFQEKELGSLEVGKWADFVVLDRDIMTVPAKEVLETKVLETWIGGKRVYHAK